MEQDIRTILFLDIETVSQEKDWEELNPRMQELWKKKGWRFLTAEEKAMEAEEVDWDQSYKRKAAILSEFGKIVCISVGFLTQEEGGAGYSMRIKSFRHSDELTLLTEFAALVDETFQNRQIRAFCGHNVKEFDLPYIGRRMLIHGLPLPAPLNFQGKKPWELKHVIDTLDLWKFGDYKHFTSLDLLAAVFEIPSPKSDLDGSQVGKVYWEESDLDRVVKYCERDVWVTAAVYLRLRGLEYPSEDSVTFVE